MRCERSTSGVFECDCVFARVRKHHWKQHYYHCCSGSDPALYHKYQTSKGRTPEYESRIFLGESDCINTTGEGEKK